MGVQRKQIQHARLLSFITWTPIPTLMKTFHSVPPQATSKQSCWRRCCPRARYELRRSQSCFPDSQLLPRAPYPERTRRHWPLLSRRGRDMLPPHAALTLLRASGEHPAPSSWRESHSPANLRYLHISTSRQTAVQSFTPLHDQQSSTPK